MMPTSTVPPVHPSNLEQTSVREARAARLVELKPGSVGVPGRAADEAEFSERARALSEGSRPVRGELVARVREEIRSGVYESEGKLDYVAGRLSVELDVTG